MTDVSSRPSRPPKPDYRHVVLDRVVARSRDDVWQVLCDFLADDVTGGYVVEGDPPPHGRGATKRFTVGGVEVTEVTLGFEQPWRRVYEIRGAPVAHYQGFMHLVPDDAGCRLIWSSVALVDGDGAGEEFLSAAEAAISERMELVVARAQRGAG